MSVLAPSDGPALSDNPPEPLPLKEREAIWRRLEAEGSRRAKAPCGQEQLPDVNHGPKGMLKQCRVAR